MFGKMLKLFSDRHHKKRCHLCFNKSPKYYLNGSYSVVADAKIISILTSLKDKYNFEIIRIDINDHHTTSTIAIECNPKDKYNIFIDFCVEMGDKIENIKM